MNKKIYILIAIVAACVAAVVVLSLKLQKEVAAPRANTETTLVPSDDILPSPPVPDASIQNEPFSYGRFDQCCFKGWVYDNDLPVKLSIVVENIDYPGLTRTFSSLSTDPQTEILFHERDDVQSYLKKQGVYETHHKIGFTITPHEYLYPGRYKLRSATYNGKPLDVSVLPSVLFTGQWIGAYEKRYNPLSKEYILHGEDFDILYNEGVGKTYPIKPRADLLGTYSAKWSPNAKYIAYAYAAPAQANFAKLTFNVLSPDEVRKQSYKNPNRVLVGGDGLLFEWLDNTRIVVAALIEKQGGGNSEYYKRAQLQVYNAASDAFEYPMKEYIDNVYSVNISPDRKKFLFEVPSTTPEDQSLRSYIVTTIAGAEIKRLNSFTENWFLD